MRGDIENQSLMRCWRPLGFILGLLLLNHLSISADFTSSVAGGDWDDTNSWNEAGFPGAADNVTITSTINVNVASACTNLTINNGGVLNRSNANTLSVSGNFTMNGTASTTGTNANRITNVTGNMNIGTGATATYASGALTVTGTTTVDGDLTFSHNAGVKTFEGLVDVQSNGPWTSTAVTADNRLVFQNGITSNGSSFSAHRATFNTNNQIISGSTTVSFAHNISVDDAISLTNSITAPASLNGRLLQGDGDFTQNVNTILVITRNVTLTGVFDASATGNSVTYNITANNLAPVCTDYHDLNIVFAGANRYTFTCSTNITGDFSFSGSTATIRSDNGTAYNHVVTGSTTLNGTFDIRQAASTLDAQTSLSMNGGTIMGTTGSGGVSVGTTFTTTGSASTISDCNFDVNGASTINAPLSFDNDNGIKTFTGQVSVSGTGSLTSTAITTNGNLIFQNGISSSGVSFAAGAATFNTNAQSIDGSTALSFANTVTTTGIDVTNNNTVSISNTAAGTLTGTGTWTQGSTGTLNYAGQTITVGTFNASASANTVNYNRGGAQDIFTPSDGSYYDLTLSTSGTKTALATLDIDRNLLISSATLDVNANTADLTIAGNWTNDGTFTQGGQTVTLNGSGSAQTIGGSTSTDFNILVLNNASGFTLATAIAALNGLTMTAGNVDLNSSTLTLGTSAAVPGTMTYTAGDLYNGSFIRYYNTPTQTLGTDTGLFPMADTDGNTRPLYINPSTALSSGGTLAVSITTSDQASTITAVDDNGDDIVRRHNSSWDVTTGGGISGGAYGIRAGGTGFGDIDDVTDLRLMTGGGVSGNHGGSGGSTSSPSIDRTAVPSGSIGSSFHIGSIDATNSPLPIKLLSFSAKHNLDHVTLDWSTATELNNDYFSIERSADGINFIEIATIDGAGNSTEELKYSYTDYSSLSEESFYRLKQTDFDGMFETFEPVLVNAKVELKPVLYPNPLNQDSFSIDFNRTISETWSLHIFDGVGKRINFDVSEKANGLEVFFGQQIKPGTYLVIFSSEAQVIRQKLLVR